MPVQRLVVIGGDAAGMSAAAQARRSAPVDDLEVLAFERGPRTSYAACGLPYLVGGEVADATRLVARTPEQFRANGIDVQVRHEVVEVDTAARRVCVRDLDAGTERHEPYDQLLIATGARGVRPPLPGIDAGGVLELRTIDQAAELEQVLTTGARRAVVVGGGYIGIEVAEALVARGLDVAMVEMAEHCMATVLDPSMASLVDDAVRAGGVDLRLGTPVAGFAVKDGRVRGVETGSGGLDADVVVLGLGVRAETGLADAAGVPVGRAGGIVVDNTMHTPVDGVWAAGDCVESHHRVSGRPAVVALGTHANKQGRVAGTNIAAVVRGDAPTARFGGVLGTAVTRFQRTEVGRTGLTAGEATELGHDIVAVTTEAPSRARYYPGGEPMQILVVAERVGGRLLGAQIVGGDASAKRIDVLATALWNDMTVDEIGGMDLSYAPPFSPVWDPVLLAAGKAAAAVARP